MIPSDFLHIAIEPALSLLPPRMDTPEARSMLLAIALQESRLVHRRQMGGPAVSYFQFELIGVEGVLTHPASARLAQSLCLSLDVGPTAPLVYQAIEFQDVLACGLARLALWQIPTSLPLRDQAAEAFDQYLAKWQPGRPRPETWAAHFVNAWSVVA